MTNLNFSEQLVVKIKELTRGQSEDPLWYDYHKGVISGSRVHKVKSKMNKFKKGTSELDNIFGLIQKVSGNQFTSPDIPALKYGRNMEASCR